MIELSESQQSEVKKSDKKYIKQTQSYLFPHSLSHPHWVK